MDYEIAGIVFALLMWAAWAVVTERRQRRMEELGQLPPGPRPWPVVGNMFQLVGSATAPHQLFAELAKQHGPIMTLHLGSMTTVVISSSEAARVMFKNHDAVLAGRKIYESMKGDIGNEGSLITAQYGAHWRTLRRLCTAEFFATGPLDSMRDVRARCVDRMVQYIRDAAIATVPPTKSGTHYNKYLFTHNSYIYIIFITKLPHIFVRVKYTLHSYTMPFVSFTFMYYHNSKTL